MHGVHTAIVTPFAADGSVDLDCFRALVRRQVEAGIHGVVVCGTTGESPTVEAEERDALLRVALEEAGGRLEVTIDRKSVV